MSLFFAHVMRREENIKNNMSYKLKEGLWESREGEDKEQSNVTA